MYKFAIYIIFIFVLSTNADSNEKKSPYPDGNPEKDGPGVSACRFDGSVDMPTCKDDAMSRRRLPSECTSMFLVGWKLRFRHNKLIMDRDIDLRGYIQDFQNENRITYLFHGHSNQGKWLELLDADGKEAYRELSLLQDKISSSTYVKGLVLSHIFEDVTCFPESFTSNLINYIIILKKVTIGFQIALRLSAASILNQPDCNKLGVSLDFQALNEVVDFYYIDFTDFNKCSDEYINTGIIPMDGPGNNLKKLSIALKKLNIPKNKIHFEFLISPSVPDSKKYDYYTCFVRYTKICEKQDGTDKWCADTTSSLREKGMFAKENGAGFVAKYIDTSDRNVACKCYDSKYPTFFFMLDGWHDMNKDKKCPKIDRQ